MFKKLIEDTALSQRYKYIDKLTRVEEWISLLSDNLASEFIFHKGKRIRSILFFMSSEPNDKNLSVDTLFYKTIALIELIHAASLLHDDVIDCNTSRRKQDSFFKRFGSKMSVLTGDYLLIKAIKKFNQLYENNSYARRVFMRECDATAYGVIYEQNLNALTQCPKVEEYIRMASLKTSPFFKAACFFGSYLSQQNFEVAKKKALYGVCFGVIYQVQNDLDSYSCEDYQKSEDYVQKNITFPIVVMCNYLSYDINEFKNITTEDGYNFIKETINSESFKILTMKILERYISKFS